MGSSGSDSKRAGRRAGVSDALGCLLGWPRELACWRVGLARLGQACLRLRVGQQSRVSELGWLGKETGWADRSLGLRGWLHSYLFFLFFSFLLLCLNSNLVLEFEFKIGVPCSLEFLGTLFSYFV